MTQSLTKQRIWVAFNDLLLSKNSFNKITVALIIKKSGVAKSTFYRHFRDKFDVLNYNSMALADKIIGQCVCTCWKDFLLCMFQGISKDLLYYKKAFRTYGQNDHSDFLYTYSFSIVERCYLTHNRKEVLTTIDYFRIKAEKA